MGIEGQQSFDSNPLGKFRASVVEQEPTTKPATERFETEDGFRVALDRNSDKRGMVVRLENNSNRTEFLVMNGQLYNPTIIREGTIDESVSKRADEQIIHTHGRKLTTLISQGLIH